MENYNHTLKSPLIAITSALATIAWLILFVGACAVPFHGVVWFIIIYELVLVVGIIALLGLNVFRPYYNMAYLFLTVSLMYLTWLCQWTLNQNYTGGARAATAGSVILIIVEFIWSYELTTPDGGTWLSGGSFNGLRAHAVNLGQKFSSSTSPNDSDHNDKKPLPRRGFDEDFDAVIEIKEEDDAIEHITALRDYQASPHDPNELSFVKNELLDILDKRGKWWIARKIDGSIGIVPSNYFY